MSVCRKLIQDYPPSVCVKKISCLCVSNEFRPSATYLPLRTMISPRQTKQIFSTFSNDYSQDDRFVFPWNSKWKLYNDCSRGTTLGNLLKASVPITALICTREMRAISLNIGKKTGPVRMTGISLSDDVLFRNRRSVHRGKIRQLNQSRLCYLKNRGREG